MKKGTIITYVLAVFAFLIVVILKLTPPKDFDAGPMLAHNLLFYFPLFLCSLVLSVVVLLRLKTLAGTMLPKLIVIILVSPTLLMFSFEVIRFSNYEEPDFTNVEFHNNTIELNINDTLEVKLYGYTKTVKGENREKIQVNRISLVPYIRGEYRYQDGGQFMGSGKVFKFYYRVINDSLQCYFYNADFSFYNNKRIHLPFEFNNAMQSNENPILMDTTIFKSFKWKEIYH